MADYTLKDYVKEDLGISGTDKDDQIDRYIRSVTAYLNRLIFGKSGESFEAANYDEYYDILEVPRNNHIFLLHKPVNSITSIIVAGETLTTDEYEIYLDEGKIILWAYTTGRKQARVQYNAGYLIDWTDPTNEAVHTLPWEIEEMARMLVVERWNEKAGGGNVKSESIGSWSRTFFSANERMQGYFDDILSSYIDPVV